MPELALSYDRCCWQDVDSAKRVIRLCRAGIKCPRGVVRLCGQPALFPFKLPHRAYTAWYCARHYEETALFYAVHDAQELRASNRDRGSAP
jgi:hypothetical protein